MTFDYFYGTRADQYSFIRVPKLLITGKEFSSLTIQAKMLYGLLLDRMGMSIKNKWLDQENRVYVIYPIKEIQQDMNITKKKAMEILAELEEKGLVEDWKLFYLQILCSKYANTMQPGTYELSTAMKPRELMAVMSGEEVELEWEQEEGS